MLAAWTRHSRGERYGDSARSPGRACLRGGSTTMDTTATAVTRQMPAIVRRASRRLPMDGRTAPATATPMGWAVCRHPIATPRRSAGNHPSTTRPLAAFAEAPDAPASASRMARGPAVVVKAAQARNVVASPRPRVIARRSP